jgi:hypothetical protein
MNLFTQILITILYGLSSESIMARSLRATAEKLSQEVTQIGYAIGVLGLVVGGCFLALGKQDAGTKITNGLVGIVVIGGAAAITSLIRSAL